MQIFLKKTSLCLCVVLQSWPVSSSEDLFVSFSLVGQQEHQAGLS